ncbi:MAG: glycosyltransferase [Oscillospiraceae bacterium]|nr:glycosyltransferase [Oscillospiraceae bacterium]
MTNGIKPLVSVVCLCYNHEDTVAGAIEGVLSQKTDFPFELIIHDDASTDNTAEIVRSYAEKYPEIIVPVLQTENQMKTCNIAETYISPLLRGRFVAICEGDDFWTSPDKLAKQTAVMLADPGITMTFHGVLQLDDTGEKISYRPVKNSGEVAPGVIIKRGGMFCPSVSLMVRRDIADMWPRFRQLADVYDYPLQALCAAEGKAYYIDEIMAAYRFAHKNSWTANNLSATNRTHILNEINWISLFNEYSEERFSYEINWHLTHLWLTEYRKSFSKEFKKNALVSAKKLRIKDKTVFILLILMFSVLKKRGETVYGSIKKLILK